MNWILHIILLILGEIWREQLYKFTLVDVLAKVAKVNAEALNTKSYQPWQKHCRGSAEAQCIFISYLSILFGAVKNAEIWGLWIAGGGVQNVWTNILIIKFIVLRLHFFYKQLGSGLSLHSCLYFHCFWGAKLLNGCLVVW